MQRSPWETNSHSATQGIPLHLRNPKIHYCVYKNPPLVPNLDHMNPDHNFPPYFSKSPSFLVIPNSPLKIILSIDTT
jgi:hypothetical protein